MLYCKRRCGIIWFCSNHRLPTKWNPILQATLKFGSDRGKAFALNLSRACSSLPSEKTLQMRLWWHVDKRRIWWRNLLFASCAMDLMSSNVPSWGFYSWSLLVLRVLPQLKVLNFTEPVRNSGCLFKLAPRNLTTLDGLKFHTRLYRSTWI